MQGRIRRQSTMLVASCVVLAACGGGGGGGTTNTMPPPVNGPAWPGFARDSQHSALGSTSAQGGVAAQALNRIAWTTTVDTMPPTTTQIHYGSMLISAHNTVVVPVKTGSTGAFQINAILGGNGMAMWSANTDYVLPPYTGWIPSYGPTLTAGNRVYYAGSGGKVYYRDAVDTTGVAPQTVVFYGAVNYQASPASYDTTVFINTPLTADTAGNVYFGFQTQGTPPLGLTSGFVRIPADGSAPVRVAAAALVAGAAAPLKSAMNAAPALSPDGTHLYVLVATVPASGSAGGYLVELDAATMTAVNHSALLKDPNTLAAAVVSDDSTASPLVGPDGDVYVGVLESDINTFTDPPGPSHVDRGWLLHFDATLTVPKTPGSFGWDNTPSIVPAALVGGYAGTSTYLILSKYNNYADFTNGDGRNRMAILDPGATQADPVVSSVSVMKEVITLLGQTPDPAFTATKPSAVKEWCVNTGAVDPVTRSVLVNSEDGTLYRWDLATGGISQRIALNGGIPQAYTPTALGPDGAVYAINGAMLHSVQAQ